MLAEMADQRADIDTLLTIIQRMHSTRRRASHRRAQGRWSVTGIARISRMIGRNGDCTPRG